VNNRSAKADKAKPCGEIFPNLANALTNSVARVWRHHWLSTADFQKEPPWRKPPEAV
jgi:hypothetical protein